MERKMLYAPCCPGCCGILIHSQKFSFTTKKTHPGMVFIASNQLEHSLMPFQATTIFNMPFLKRAERNPNSAGTISTKMVIFSQQSLQESMISDDETIF